MKYRKKQFISMIQTLQKANSSVTVGDESVQEEMQDLLGQCQEFAIQIGNELEKRGEKEIVSLLEDYCELLYQQSLVLDNIEECKKYCKDIRKLLIKISSTIELNVEDDKKEVVFFPYKASMWDSLESIWLAAKDDENLDVYVVPIPYYDGNPELSLGEMHYEGNEYPEYVPITSWEEYIVSERQPDVAFIHNPYDDTNFVTTVHPNFYARELKKYVGELVYVPYFILAPVEPSNQEAVDEIKHFITTPGVVYADKVIVQSEKMKQVYVNEYLEFAKEQGLQGEHLSRKYQENRILGLGSPKIDKVLTSKKEDYSIPDEWNKKIDGKQVILFNTTISTALAHNEKYLEKLRYILNVFKNSNDVVLWWRPHPLFMSTLETMRPQLFNEYKSIVNGYKCENYGIYDDSVELNRAIAYSNRYYGDWSSVVWLYGFTEKSVLTSTLFKMKRQNNILDYWCAGDYEQGDLEDWIQGEEKWVLTKKYSDFSDIELKEKSFGQIIYESILKEE